MLYADSIPLNPGSQVAGALRVRDDYPLQIESQEGLFLALIFTQDWRPGLLSAVPPGLNLERVVLTQAR